MGKAVYTTYESLAQKAGLIFDAKTGIIYGRRNGFDAFVYAADSNYPYRLTVSIGANKESGMLPKEAWKEFEKAHKPIQSVKNERNFVEMVLRPTNNKEKLGENFLECFDALTGFLMANGYVNCCYFCGQHVETQPYFVNQALLNLCPECSARVTQELHMSGQEKKQKKENIVAGIVGALIGSLLGVLCIVILGQLGYVAALSGLVMVICTLKG